MKFKTIFLSYLGSIILNLLVGFWDTYKLAWDLSLELHNRVEDCKVFSFASRHPQLCAETMLNPPASWLVLWAGLARERVSLCGPIVCSELFSSKGVVVLGTLFVLSLLVKGN